MCQALTLSYRGSENPILPQGVKCQTYDPMPYMSGYELPSFWSVVFRVIGVCQMGENGVKNNQFL